MDIKPKLAFALLACFALAGCENLSGVGGSSSFQCKAPAGVPCMSMDGVYANVRAGNLPGKDTGAVKPRRRGSAADAADWDDEAATKTAIAASGFPPRGDVAITAPPTLATAASAQPGAYGPVSPAAMNALTSGMPLRTPERILRLWVAAIEDADGVLYDQRYMYVPIERGRWQIETFLDAGARNYEPVTRMKPKEPEPRMGAAPVDARQSANAVARREAAAVPFRQANPTAPPPVNRSADNEE